MREKQHDSWWRSQAARNAVIGKYNDLMAQIPANIYNIGSSWANALSDIYQFDNMMDVEKDRHGIWNETATADKEAALTGLWQLWDRLHNNRGQSTISATNGRRQRNNAITS